MDVRIFPFKGSFSKRMARYMYIATSKLKKKLKIKQVMIYINQNGYYLEENFKNVDTNQK